MISIGPFSIRVVIVFAAALVAWVVARSVAKRCTAEKPYKAAGSLIFDALFIGLLVARLVYIAQWWQAYFATPMSMIAVGDGGYTWWAGILAALAFVGWRTRAQCGLRRSALAGVLTGVLVWAGAGAVLDHVQRTASPLPALQLTTLAGQPIDLSAYKGRPVVLNLWASWCPPCRREMPAFEQAQQAFPDVAFVMLNQGESAQKAQSFLYKEGLHFDDVLLDSSSQAMQALGARGLPTSFFIDAEGFVVHAHMGELTLATISNAVERHFAGSARPF